MLREAIATGATVEEAKEAACKELGVESFDDHVEFEILEMSSKKVFGLFGGRPAKVKVTIKKSVMQSTEEYIKNIITHMGLNDITVTTTENDNIITELNVFNQLNSALKLTIWTCNKLTSIYDQINEDDSIAKKIFEDYRLLCEKRILEVDTSIFDVLSAIEIQDCVVRDSIRDAIEILKQFITSIESNPNWFVGSDILKEVFDHINDMKMYAQMQLLSGKKLN